MPRSNHILGILVFIIYAFSSTAGAVDVCTDLARASCSGGGRPDGTNIPLPRMPSEDSLKAGVRAELALALQRNRANLGPKLMEVVGAACPTGFLIPSCEPDVLTMGTELMWHWLNGGDEVAGASARALAELRNDPAMMTALNRSNDLIRARSGVAAVDSRLRSLLPDVQALMVSLIEQQIDGEVSPPTIMFCPGQSRSADSTLAFVSTLAHELGHSIDFCWWVREKIRVSSVTPTRFSQIDESYPFRSAVACLRTEGSVQARRASNPDQNMSPDELNRNCQARDQGGEAMGDWFSAQILSGYMDRFHPGLSTEQRRSGVMNATRDLCGNGTDENHPEGNARVNRIYSAHPGIRRQMGCTTPLTGVRQCGQPLRLPPATAPGGAASGGGTASGRTSY
ncbi:MAG: hypothetical protein V4760_14375 [Bdellovibrionota bacterium]